MPIISVNLLEDSHQSLVLSYHNMHSQAKYVSDIRQIINSVYVHLVLVFSNKQCTANSASPRATC
jgi:hypothetical protein